jgi:hypothetical protein
MPPPPALKKKAGTKNPPIFSQEYLIQNHGKEGSKWEFSSHSKDTRV